MRFSAGAILTFGLLLLNSLPQPSAAAATGPVALFSAARAADAAADCAPLSDATFPTAAVNVADWRIEASGLDVTSVLVGTVRNNCLEERELSLAAIIWEQRAGQQSPLALTNKDFWTLQPGETAEFELNMGRLPGDYWRGNMKTDVTFRAQSRGSGDDDSAFCFDVGAADCLQADYWLGAAIADLRTIERGAWLLKVAAENGVAIGWGRLPSHMLAAYSTQRKLIIIDVELDTASDWETAAVLAHELQHAADDAAAGPANSRGDCLDQEAQAFRRQADVWLHFWQDQLRNPHSEVHDELNSIAQAMDENPLGFVADLVTAYRHQCTFEQ